MTRLPQPRKNARRPRTRVPGNGNDKRGLEMLELVRSLRYITCLLAIAPRAAITPSTRRS